VSGVTVKETRRYESDKKMRDLEVPPVRRRRVPRRSYLATNGPVATARLNSASQSRR
jgi:hypothetical protein